VPYNKLRNDLLAFGSKLVIVSFQPGLVRRFIIVGVAAVTLEPPSTANVSTEKNNLRAIHGLPIFFGFLFASDSSRLAAPCVEKIVNEGSL